MVLLLANLSILVGTLALRAPILWLKLQRKATAEAEHEARHGTRRSRDIAHSSARQLAPPVLAAVLILVAQQLIDMTGIEIARGDIQTLFNCIAVFMMFPFANAFCRVFAERPFILQPLPFVYVFLHSVANMDGLGFIILFMCFNVSLS